MPMIYNRQMETMPRKEIEALQLERLRHLVRYCYDNVKLYHDRFDAAGLDPDVYTGFYVNIGLDRLVMMRYGVDDVRLFHSADLRFLKQFR